MKTLLTLFVLLFSSSVFADNISDFQIEGMSVGDSLLDYFSEEEIFNNKINYFQGKRQFYVVSSGNLKLNNFDSIEFYLKTDDSKFIIRYFGAFIFYSNNFDDCKIKQQEIVSEIKYVLKNAKMIDEGTFSHIYDKTGKSKQTRINFLLNSDYVSVECLNWSKEIHKENPSWFDNLSLIAGTDEVMQWFASGYK